MSTTGGGGAARVRNLRVLLSPLDSGWQTQGEEGRINVLPWYRLVGVMWYLQLDPLTRRGRPGCPQVEVVATWYGDDSPHLSLPDSQPLSAAARRCARVTGKAGENSKFRRRAARSVWTRPSARGCGDKQALSEHLARSELGDQGPGSVVAVDWVTSWS